MSETRIKKCTRFTIKKIDKRAAEIFWLLFVVSGLLINLIIGMPAVADELEVVRAEEMDRRTLGVTASMMENEGIKGVVETIEATSAQLDAQQAIVDELLPLQKAGTISIADQARLNDALFKINLEAEVPGAVDEEGNPKKGPGLRDQLDAQLEQLKESINNLPANVLASQSASGCPHGGCGHSGGGSPLLEAALAGAGLAAGLAVLGAMGAGDDEDEESKKEEDKEEECEDSLEEQIVDLNIVPCTSQMVVTETPCF